MSFSSRYFHRPFVTVWNENEDGPNPSKTAIFLREGLFPSALVTLDVASFFNLTTGVQHESEVD